MLGRPAIGSPKAHMNYNRHDEKAPADFSAGAGKIGHAIFSDARQVRSSIERSTYFLAPDPWFDAECGQSLLELLEVSPCRGLPPFGGPGSKLVHRRSRDDDGVSERP